MIGGGGSPMAQNNTDRITISLPKTIIKKIDKYIEKDRYASRSHCVRVGMTKLLEELEEEERLASAELRGQS
jgi:Arc/MetJ-type ribon-helix-helix transcriptional regulator